jgi:hypothetical protein
MSSFSSTKIASLLCRAIESERERRKCDYDEKSNLINSVNCYEMLILSKAIFGARVLKGAPFITAVMALLCAIIFATETNNYHNNDDIFLFTFFFFSLAPIPC